MKKNKLPNSGISRRAIPFEFRMETSEGSNERIIRGHGSVFNSLSEDLGGFREIIHPGAFDAALAKSDVRCLFNHDPSLVLGRSASGTLKLSLDETGLAYECSLPDTTLGRDLAVSIDRGDVSQSSFAFTLDWDDESGEKWEYVYEDEQRGWILHIRQVEELFDVSPVTYPAYQAADVRSALQGLTRAKDALENNEKQKLDAALQARQRTLSIHQKRSFSYED